MNTKVLKIVVGILVAAIVIVGGLAVVKNLGGAGAQGGEESLDDSSKGSVAMTMSEASSISDGEVPPADDAAPQPDGAAPTPEKQ